MPGQECRHGCGSEFDTVPPDIHDWPARFHTKVPIEGVGVVHVLTEPNDCRYDYWTTDVVLWRYAGTSVKERVYLTGSGCSALSADEMHTYWSDLETLVLCTQGVRYALHLIDEDYMDRKFRQLFGRPYID